MYSLNQEFPVGKGHHSFLKRLSELQKDLSGKLVEHASVESQVFQVRNPIADDWSAEWISNEWIENHTKAAGVGIRPFSDASDPMIIAVLREEDFGAVLFEPLSDRVFRLNQAGAKLYRAIRESYLANDRVFKVKALAGFSTSQVAKFTGYLKLAGLLWIPH
jgi:hypothetical protein